MKDLIDFDTNFAFWVALFVFVAAVLIDAGTRVHRHKKRKHQKPHSDRIHTALERIRAENVEKVTKQLWQELVGVDKVTAGRDLEHLVHLGVFKKQGRGRGVYYAPVKRRKKK